MRLGLVYDLFDAYPWRDGDPPDADAEYEPPETLEALEAATRSLGWEPVRVGTAYDLADSLPDLRAGRLQLDAVLSIAEAARSRNREAYAPILCELAGVPLLGSDALTMSISLDKAATKDLARAAGVPTPAYRVYESAGGVSEGDWDEADFPLFVKPRYEGSAKGIAPSSKVASFAALRGEVERQAGLYRQDVLAERFVSGGGEFTVGVIGPADGRGHPQRGAVALPTIQRAVESASAIGLHALEARGARHAGPDEPLAYHLEGTLGRELEARLQAGALAVFAKLGCRDFARVDFRVDEAGTPYFLEINPLPTFAPDGTFAIVAELLGVSYDAFLADVLRRALVARGLG